MSMNPLIDLYVSTLNEGVNSPEVKGSTIKKGSDAFGKFSEANEADENVKKDLENPKEDKEHSNEDGSKGKPEKMKMSKESSNPFDKLFNQYLAEDFGGDFSSSGSPEMNNGGLEMGSSEGSDEVPITDENIDEPEEEQGEGGIKGAIAALEQALNALKGMVGEEEGSEESGGEDEFSWEEDDTNEFGGSDDNAVGESVDLKKAPEFDKSLTDPKSANTKKGAVPEKGSKKAETPNTGKGNDGKLEKAPDKKDAFQGATKSQDVKGVKAGKFLFDQ